MFIILGLICLGVGVRFTSTHPEIVWSLGPADVTYSHLLFAAGALCIIRGIWKWVND